MNTQTAVFGGGCFWCTEAVFRSLKGVTGVMPGYAGGTVANPTYEQVCGGNTGHAEVIKIDYNPSTISFRDLLSVFFNTHDPTSLNRQGNDVGTQYRSVILYTTPEQKAEAETLIKELNDARAYAQPVVTTLEPLTDFYPAENYHQNYYENHADAPYCQIVIAPKLEKLNERFKQLLATN
jgi:peptide-methionine (S)-S-oxide reductase